jgi:hypothetical protein
VAFGKKFQANELLALVEALDGQDQAGIPLPDLANRTGLSLETARKLVTKYTDYFVSIGGEPVYALNRFGPFSGSAKSIREDVKRRAETLEKKQGWLLWAFQHFFRAG